MPTQPPPPSNLPASSSPTPQPYQNAPGVPAEPDRDRVHGDLVPKEPDPQDPGKPTGFLSRTRDDEGLSREDLAREEEEAQRQDLEDAKAEALAAGQDPEGDFIITENLPPPFFMIRRYRGVGPLAYETSRGLLKVNSGELIAGFLYHHHDEEGNDLEEEFREFIIMSEDAFRALQDDFGPDSLPESLDVRAIKLGRKRRGDPPLGSGPGDTVDNKLPDQERPEYKKGTIPADRKLRPGERPRAEFRDTPAQGTSTPPGATTPKPPAPVKPASDLKSPPTTTSSSAT